MRQQSGTDDDNIPFKKEIKGREGGSGQIPWLVRVLIFVLLFRRFTDDDGGRGGRDVSGTCACGGPAMGRVGRGGVQVPNGVPRRDAPPRRNSFP